MWNSWKTIFVSKKSFKFVDFKSKYYLSYLNFDKVNKSRRGWQRQNQLVSSKFGLIILRIWKGFTDWPCISSDPGVDFFPSPLLILTESPSFHPLTVLLLSQALFYTLHSKACQLKRMSQRNMSFQSQNNTTSQIKYCFASMPHWAHCQWCKWHLESLLCLKDKELSQWRSNDPLFAWGLIAHRVKHTL